MKKPTLKEKLDVYEQFFFRLNFHRTVTMNEKAVFALLRLSDGWCEAHSTANGERGDKEVEENVNQAFEKLKHLP
jgi:hypothetical protein